MVEVACGTVLADRYRVGKLLGSGGMSRVYACDDLKLPGKRWAVKLLTDGLCDVDGAAAMTDEAELLSRLRHPALPAIVDLCDWSGGRALVLELIEGETLEQRFERMGRTVTDREAVQWALQIAACLLYLHSQQPQPVVYRDLKPSNVMLDAGERIRLIDFGIARHHKPGASQDTVHMGTVGFASPEQMEGRQTGPASDVYALGALLHYLLAGGIAPDYRRRRDSSQAAAGGGAELRAFIASLLDEREERRPPTADVEGWLIRWLERYRIYNEPSGTGLGQLPELAREGVPGELGPGPGLPRTGGRSLIVIGGWRRGAGATTAAMTLARALGSAGYSSAVAEWPTAEPYLQMWLGSAQAAVHRGQTVWLPAIAGDAEQQLARLRSAPGEFILVDIGSAGWLTADTQLLLTIADGIVAVGDTHVGLWQTQPEETLPMLRRREEMGTPVWWIANRDVQIRGRSEWLDSFAAKPVCRMPALPWEAVTEAEWRAVPVADMQPWGKALLDSVLPLVQIWTGGSVRTERGKTGWTKLWTQRKGMKRDE